MEIDKWVNGYKVRLFPWIDGKRIYFNVQYHKPGSSLERPPAFDKSVFITDNEAGRNLIENWTATLTEFVARMKVMDNHEVTLRASVVGTLEKIDNGFDRERG